MRSPISFSHLSALFVATACVVGPASDAYAQARGARPIGGGTVVGRAVARPVGPVVGPRGVGVAPFRPYYYPYRYPYRSGIGFGFYAGFGYPYYGYGWGYPYFGYGAYGYPYYGYGYNGYPSYGYPYYGGGYGYYPPAGYVSAQPGVGYGGIRIDDAPKDAQVFADGYYVGVVDDFHGYYQHLNLPAGVHQLEIRPLNQPPVSFEVNVQAGQTIKYHAGLKH
jgi:hypothetical protein